MQVIVKAKNPKDAAEFILEYESDIFIDSMGYQVDTVSELAEMLGEGREMTAYPSYDITFRYEECHTEDRNDDWNLVRNYSQ